MISKIKTIFIPVLTLLLLFMIFPFIGLTQEAEQHQNFSLYSEFTNIIVEKGKSFDLDTKIINTGQEPEEILLSVIPDQKAQNWENYLQTSDWNGFKIRSVGLLAKEPDNSKTIKFHIEIPEDAKIGNYKFTLKGITKDQAIEKTLDFIINVIEKKEELNQKIPGEIVLTAKYPAIENPAGKEFKFDISIENKTKENQALDLGINLPQGWNAYCTPQWKDNRISSVKVDAGSTENLTLTITPPMFAEKGEYPIEFIIRSGENKQNIDLSAVVTGTYKLNLKTETGQLNIDTISGEEKSFIVYLWNEGSAPIDNISFFSQAPENWEVTFKPENISALPPVIETQKPEKVEVTIKTPQQTLPGDYMTTLNFAGTQDQKNIEIRTTVKTSTKWGWIGVGIIAIIFVILIGIFIKLKRR